MSKNKVRPYVLEEKWHARSHGIGVLLALVGCILLLNKDMTGTPFLSSSVTVYCLSLLLLFSASTAYHSTESPKRKKRLRILDHISIYYLIAGTYTPVCLSLLPGSKGWLLFYLVWGIALLGTFLKLFYTGRFEAF